MNILFIAPRLHSNQSGLIKKLIEEHHTVNFLTIGRGNSEDYSYITPFTIKPSLVTQIYTRLKFKNKKIDIFKYSNIFFPSFVNLYLQIFRFSPNKIIVRVGNYPLVYFLFPLFVIQRKKIILYSQDPKYVKSQSLKKRLFSRFISLNYSIPWYTPVLYKNNVSISELKENKFLTFIPFFIYCNVTVENVKHSKNNPIKFLCVAKYEKRKGLEKLIEAVNNLCNSGYNFKISIVGSTGTEGREEYFTAIKNLINKKNLEETISILKNVPHKEMGSLFKSHDVFILPTTKELASVSQLEAMSYGLAIICSRDNGTAHYIQDNHNGFLINPNVDDIILSMQVYLRSSEILIKHRINSVKLVNGPLSIDFAYKQLSTLLRLE